MTQSSVLALGVATAVLQQLQAVLALASAPCLTLSEQIASLTGKVEHARRTVFGSHHFDPRYARPDLARNGVEDGGRKLSSLPLHSHQFAFPRPARVWILAPQEPNVYRPQAHTSYPREVMRGA